MSLAELAANQNTPVLLMSGRPDEIMRKSALDLPCLRKPFDILALSTTTAREIAARRENIERLKSGMARLGETIEGLSDAMAFSQILVAKSRAIVAEAIAQKL